MAAADITNGTVFFTEPLWDGGFEAGEFSALIFDRGRGMGVTLRQGDAASILVYSKV